MAFVAVEGSGVIYPGGISNSSHSVSYVGSTIDADGEASAWIIPMPKAGTINRVGFRLGTVAQAPVAGLSLNTQGLTTQGVPDGLPTAVRTVPQADISSNAWVETGLITDDGTDDGNKITVAAGQYVAFVVEFEGFVAGDSVISNYAFQGPFRGNGAANVYNAQRSAAGTWSKATTANPLVFAIQYEDGDEWIAIDSVYPVHAINTENFSNSVDPDERGIKFTLPVPLRVRGIVALHNGGAGNNGTGKYRLLDANDNILAETAVWDPEFNSNSGVITTRGYRFTSAIAEVVELEANTTYRMTLVATGSANVSFYSITPPSLDYMSAMPLGPTWIRTTRNNGTGSWTDTVLGLQFNMGLIVDAIDPVKGDGRGRGILRNICNFMRSFLR